jgi:hypothetical protein
LVPAGLSSGSGRTAAAAVARGLRLAATPVFAVLALLSGASGGELPAALCLTSAGSAPLTGMTTMYALMGVFHAGPWLELIARRRP